MPHDRSLPPTTDLSDERLKVMSRRTKCRPTWEECRSLIAELLRRREEENELRRLCAECAITPEMIAAANTEIEKEKRLGAIVKDCASLELLRDLARDAGYAKETCVADAYWCGTDEEIRGRLLSLLCEFRSNPPEGKK